MHLRVLILFDRDLRLCGAKYAVHLAQDPQRSFAAAEELMKGRQSGRSGSGVRRKSPA